MSLLNCHQSNLRVYAIFDTEVTAYWLFAFSVQKINEK
jgi:hypothetical protein